LICPNTAAADAANSLVAEKLLNLGELSLAAPTHKNVLFAGICVCSDWSVSSHPGSISQGYHREKFTLIAQDLDGLTAQQGHFHPEVIRRWWLIIIKVNYFLF
jgi:hypothetical protein